MIYKLISSEVEQNEDSHNEAGGDKNDSIL